MSRNEESLRAQADHPAGRRYWGPHGDDRRVGYAAEDRVSAPGDGPILAKALVLVFTTFVLLGALVAFRLIHQAFGWTGVVLAGISLVVLLAKNARP